MFSCCHFYFRLHLLLIIIHITCILLSLCQTSAPMHLTSVLGVLGTRETSCIVIAGLLERDSFNLLLPEFDKPWVIHLRKTCCCSTNICTWRPNTVYKNRSMRRHQGPKIFPQNILQSPTSSTRVREGPEACPGTLPERGIITRGLLHHHASIQRDAWVVHP
jgi:hypothetical protein